MEKTYNGIAISDKIKNGRTAGEISVTRKGLSFKSEKAEITLPLLGLKIEKGGAANNLLFFTHTKKEGWSVYTDQKDILKEELFTEYEELKTQIQQFNKNKIKNSILLSIGTAFAGILFYFAFLASSSLKDFAVKEIAAKIPLEWEEKLGGMAGSGVSSHIITNESINKDLGKITAPILKEINKDNARKYKFKFVIVDDKVVNAFALPGGTVIINSGLLLKTESPEELAGVLAHEISHVTRQHGVRQIIQSIGIYMIVQTLLGDVQGILAVLLDNSGFLLNLKFSRDFEREADDSGFKYLVGAEIDPTGMVSFFDKMKEEEKKVTGGEVEIPSIISTHPATDERINNLKKKLNKIESKNKYIKINLDYKKFKNKIRHTISYTEE